MRISPEAEARVRRAARETGYRPNIVSRSLRTGASQTIGFVSDTVATTPFAGHLIWGALDAARDRGHLLIIGETEGDPDLEQQAIEAMRDRGVDGIVYASMYTREIVVPKDLSSGPAVLLNAVPAKSSPVPSVVPDELQAGRTVARLLLDAGHGGGIAVIGASPPNHAPKGALAAVERLRGIMEALDHAGAQLVGAIECSEWQPSTGYEATRKLLRALQPSAIICFNDRLALGAYQAISDVGLEVPDQISVASFDDDVIATWMRPQLTTVALPHYELGREAINVLLDLVEGKAAVDGKPAIRRIPMPLRMRASVRDLATPLPRAAAARRVRGPEVQPDGAGETAVRLRRRRAPRPSA